MKQAYLILAHNRWDILDCLLEALDYEFNDIYLHIDAKVDSLPKLREMKNARLETIEERHNVAWGDFSMVEAEYALFRKAVQRGPYTHYHLLSGVDLPLKSQQEIMDFSISHKDESLIGLRTESQDQRELAERWSYHYLFMSTNYRNKQDHRPYPLRMLLTIIRHSIVNIEKALHIKRNKDITLYKAHQWVSLSDEAMQYMLAHYDEVCRRFKQTLCPDEVFVPTLIMNSPLKSKMLNGGDYTKGSMRLIDWHRGEPYSWKIEDKDEIMNSGCLFARKIESIELAKEILESL